VTIFLQRLEVYTKSSSFNLREKRKNAEKPTTHPHALNTEPLNYVQECSLQSTLALFPAHSSITETPFCQLRSNALNVTSKPQWKPFHDVILRILQRAFKGNDLKAMFSTFNSKEWTTPTRRLVGF